MIRCSLLAIAFMILPFAAVDAQEPVKIGLILPLTGNASSWGKHMMNAANMSHDALPKDVRERIRLVFEDDQLSGAAGAAAFSKLADSDQVAAAIVFGGQSVAAVAPMAEQRKVPIFAITANRKLTEGKVYSFRHWLDARRQVAILAPYLEKRRIKRVALVVIIHEAMLDYAEQFARAAPSHGITVVYRNDFQPKESDFRTAVQKIRSSKPDAVLVVLLPPQISAFMRQLREAHVTVPAFGFSNAESSSEIEAARGTMENFVYTGSSLSTEFVADYEKRFGEFPELSAGNVYDMITLLGNAVEKGSTTRQAFRDALANVATFRGVLGHYGITNGNDFIPEPQLKVVRNLKFLRLE